MKLWNPGEAMAALGVILAFVVLGAIRGHVVGGLIIGFPVAVCIYATMLILTLRKRSRPRSARTNSSNRRLRATGRNPSASAP